MRTAYLARSLDRTTILKSWQEVEKREVDVSVMENIVTACSYSHQRRVCRLTIGEEVKVYPSSSGERSKGFAWL